MENQNRKKVKRKKGRFVYDNRKLFIIIRLNNEEDWMLKSLCKHLNINQSELLRSLIVNNYHNNIKGVQNGHA